ncbi:MAG: hypothetical protein ABJE95_08990 [Byssovorax sp.]
MDLTDPAQNPTNFRSIEKGSTFEVYQGTGRANRLDWTREGAFRTIIIGHAGGESAEVMIRRFEAMLRISPRITALYDVWDLTGYDSEFRIELTKWGMKNRASVLALHSVARSKLVNMGLSVANLAMGGIFTPHGKRADFDAIAKRLGLPLNPTMPAV